MNVIGGWFPSLTFALGITSHIMKIKHIITMHAAVLVVALSSSCSKSPTATTPTVTISADHGTNVTTVTTNGYTVMLGKTTVGTNAVGLKPSP